MEYLKTKFSLDTELYIDFTFSSTVDYGNSKPQNSKLLSKFGIQVEILLFYDLGLVVLSM